MGRAGVVVLGVLLSAVPSAAADPAAEKLFRDGQAALDKGSTAEACDLFARSLELEAKSGTALNLGNCLEQLGRTASAWEAFTTANTLALAEKPKGNAGEARRRASALLPTLAYLTIVVPAAPVTGFTLTRNAEAVEPAVWNVAVPVDPGDHVVVAGAEGYHDWSETRTIGGGEHATITVGQLAPVVKAPDPADASTSTGASTSTSTGTSTSTTEPLGAVNGAAAGAITLTAPVPAPVARKLWAIGVTMGETTGLDPMFGVRVFRDVPVGAAAVRGMFTVLYDHFNDDHTNGFALSHQVLFGGAVEYTWSSSKRLRYAVGLTAGLDLLARNMNRGVDAAPWWGIRISPVIVRALDSLEVGVHLQGIQSTDRFAAFGLVAVDWYVR